jgi:hypothetical protein
MQKHDKQPTIKGPADWFTGDVWIDPVAQPHADSTRTSARSTSTPALGPPGTRTPAGRRSTSPKGGASSSHEDRMWSRSVPATPSGHPTARSTGTARPGSTS